MNERELFGNLVGQLRTDIGLSQDKLAKKAGISRGVLESIENGSKAKVDIDDLGKLADALELTSMERREFFYAAITGLDSSKTVRPKTNISIKDTPDAITTREFMARTVGKLRIPAFVTDVFCDIIAANLLVAKFLNIPLEMVETGKKIPVGLNTMRIVFSDESGFRNIVSSEWHKNVWMNMREFRRDTFRYRAHPYYSYLMKELLDEKKYPLFADYWKKVHSDLNDHYVDIDHLEYFHPIFQVNVQYALVQSIALTEYGELLLTSYMPMNDETMALFARLGVETDRDILTELEKQGKPIPKDLSRHRVLSLAPWPEKTFLP